MADKTIALGPGFSAGVDVDLVVETQRGHNLGRIIEKGDRLRPIQVLPVSSADTEKNGSSIHRQKESFTAE